MEDISCIICGSSKRKILFSKASDLEEEFNLNRCSSCGLEYISPRPDIKEIGKYYEAQYFTQRTDRGYNDYFSDEVRNEIERVIALNLKDLKFFEFENTLGDRGKALDIG